MKTPRRTQSGFTLIELLVVIAIVAILAAILFPVFAKAREKARQTACLNNARQISTMALLYAQDHEDALPTSESFWGSLNLDQGLVVCPTAGKKMTNAYAFNTKLDGKALGDIANHSAAVLLGDGNSGLTPANVASQNSHLIGRHAGKATLCYVDGHIALAKPADVSLLYGIGGISAKIPATGIVGTGTGSPQGGQGYDKLVDGDLSTKLCIGSTSFSAYAQFPNGKKIYPHQIRVVFRR
jgi:prepilin-type N-terminal cleavage/methylation domain-containing protein/prepilin-type processing-associated H-X9-DG protein